tara:strand:+ start:271 stop:1821 length:1551 start_codon:yes stop_codon:yes gene_type:complete
MKNTENEIKIILNLFNAAKFDMVISKSKKLIREFPEYIILYNILGSAYQNTGSFNLAKDIFVKGSKIDPTNVAIMNNLANVYKHIGEIELSENLFRKIMQKDPNYINAYINLGNLKRDNNDFEMAIDLYKKAQTINDKIPVILYSLALAYQGLGKFDQAIEYAKKTLLLDPKLTQADMLISQSTKYKINDEHFEAMNSKLNNLQLNNEQKINLLFALAKASEDKNQIEKSFEYLSQGNLIKRKSLDYNINKEIKFFNDIKKIFSELDFNKISKDNNSKKNIIFILGMPRSGTSLIEQIITSHSEVFGAGELPQLSKIVKDRLMNEESISSEQVVKLINDETFSNLLRKDYYDYLKRFNAKETFITDKAPLNFRWIGLIKILFPNSKIIHCSRNPKDNCLSLYKNFFEGGLNFSYDQKELGTYYNLYLDLIKFWNEKFPGSIYEAKYEQIITNQENEIKNIINFCDLPWEESCLSFYKNKTPIKTMSTAQARQPIYKSSINSFEKFSPFLKELKKII